MSKSKKATVAASKPVASKSVAKSIKLPKRNDGESNKAFCYRCWDSLGRPDDASVKDAIHQAIVQTSPKPVNRGTVSGWVADWKKQKNLPGFVNKQLKAQGWIVDRNSPHRAGQILIQPKTSKPASKAKDSSK